MAKRKVNKGLAVFCGIFCFIVGVCAGVIGNLYLNGGGYYIPEKEASSASVAAGNFNVEEIKSKELSIHFIELGNKYTGDCTFIKVGDKEVLNDARSRASSITPIYEYVSKYVDGKLDYIIVTHAHRDHYAGFATSKYEDSLFKKFDCENVIYFSNTDATSNMYNYFMNNLEEVQKEDNAKVYTALECYNNQNGAEREIALGANITLEILYHKYYVEDAPSENDYSVCCMVNQNDEKYFLFTGDLEEEGEKSLVDEYKKANGVDLPQVELYKAGHHGSKTSSSEYMLNVIKPKVVCVCCCAGSSEYTQTKDNQFPTQSFIDRIAVHTKNVYVTTLCIDYKKASYESFNGNIVVMSNKEDEGVSVACANNNTLLKDSEWFKNNRKTPSSWAS